MVGVEIVELLTEGSKEEREGAFKQKGEYLYRCVNSVGEEQRQCILLNEYLIKDDKMWLDEQGNPALDLELACRYEKVLEERFYEALLLVEELDKKVAKVCKIMRDKEFPETQYKKEDSEAIRREKSDKRANASDTYHKAIRKKIIDRFKKSGYDLSFLEEEGEGKFLYNNMLYNCRKEDENEDKKNHIDNVETCVDLGITDYLEERKKEGITVEEKIEGEAISESDKKRIKNNARKMACSFIFLERNWDVELWMELIFLKFYKEINKNKPGAGIDEENLKKRRAWIRKESKQWLVEKGDRYTWQLTEKAVRHLVELEDEEKKLDLLNYTIRVNLSMLSEINMIISHSDVPKKTLDVEFGLKPGGFTRRLQQKTVKDMHPYVACLAWKKSNVSFDRLFQITAMVVTNRDRKVMNAYQEIRKPKTLFDNMRLGFENLEADAKEDDFWYIPKRKRNIYKVIIELTGPDKIKVTVEYLDPFVTELPYSYAMERIANLKNEKLAEILELSGFETKEELMKYCAEMVVRKYCRENYGISYQEFQRIKCHANVTITIYPLVFCKTDGSMQVGYVAKFKRNQMSYFAGDGRIGVYKEYEWKNRETLEKDWEEIKEESASSLKQEWIEESGYQKYYSEYAMQMPGFFEIIYKEPYIIDKKDSDRIIKKICSGTTICH